MATEFIELREITKDTVRAICNLKVAPEQQKFVAPNAVSIAQAYFHDDAWFRAIYDGDTPVGFVMLSDVPEKAEYYLWRLMIDAQYQGKDYGRRALEIIVDHVRTRPNAKEFFLSICPGDGNPGPFYEKFGFKYTGEEEDGELMMKLVF
jgi:diamine N-acetyltransferase